MTVIKNHEFFGDGGFIKPFIFIGFHRAFFIAVLGMPPSE
jgi:hypothetical protein